VSFSAAPEGLSEQAARIRGGELPELWVSFVRETKYSGDQRESYVTTLFKDIKFHATEIDALRDVNKSLGNKKAVRVLPGQSLDEAASARVTAR
jgi:hypothetical protein